MKEDPPTPLESRSLRYFLAVAQELHFGRAAERLGIAQPPLSRAITKLETGLGVALFARNSHKVALTDAGQVLLERGAAVITALDQAAQSTRRAGLAKRVRVVISSEVDAGIVPHAEISLLSHPVELDVEMVLRGSSAVEMIRAGTADVVFTNSGLADPRGLFAVPLTSEQRVVLLRSDHPLASRAVIDYRELAAEPLPVPHLTTHLMHRYFAGDDDESRVLRWPAPPLPPRNGIPEFVGMSHLLGLVQLGRLVIIIAPSIAKRHRIEGITAVPVANVSDARLLAIAGPTPHPPAVTAVIRAAATHCGAPDPYDGAYEAPSQSVSVRSS